jgi:hypothetical protein
MVTKKAVKNQHPGNNTPREELIIEKAPVMAVLDRKNLLEITTLLILETHARVSGDRFRVRDGDRERLAYLRTLRDLIVLQAALLKDAHAPSLIGIKYSPFDDVEDMDFSPEKITALLRSRYPE